MADTKISGLSALAETPASGDLFVIVDVSDTTDSANGTTKKVEAQYITPADYSVSLRNSTSLQSTSLTLTAVTFDTEVYDTDSMHSLANPSRITISHAGKYLITGAVSPNIDSSANDFYISIRLNGTTEIAASYANFPYVTEGLLQPVLQAAIQYNFSANDYIEIMVKTLNSATAHIINGTDINLFTFFQAKKI